MYRKHYGKEVDEGSLHEFFWLFKKWDTELSECKGVVEIEPGRDMLEASRGIRDDIAVMHSKNNLDKNDNATLVVCLSFPNKRQICLQVSKDIDRWLD